MPFHCTHSAVEFLFFVFYILLYLFKLTKREEKIKLFCTKCCYNTTFMRLSYIEKEGSEAFLCHLVRLDERGADSDYVSELSCASGKRFAFACS